MNQFVRRLYHRFVQQLADPRQFIQPPSHAADGSLPHQTRQRLIDGRPLAKIEEVAGWNCCSLPRTQSCKHLFGNRMGDIHRRLLSYCQNNRSLFLTL